jgi:ferritin-like metal-binding protein YciE
MLGERITRVKRGNGIYTESAEGTEDTEKKEQRRIRALVLLPACGSDSFQSSITTKRKAFCAWRKPMPIKTPKELFVMLLTDVRQGAEKAETIYEEIGQLVQDPQIKEALQARAFVSGKVLATLDECFKLLGEQPAKLSGRLQETLIEDFRRELAEIQGPVARRIFALVKLNHVAQFRISEYRALIAAAEAVGHYGVSLLLETCLADRLTFVDRTQRFLRELVETKVAERAAGASA